MQLFFALKFINTSRGNVVSQRDYHAKVMSYVDSLPGLQKRNLMETPAKWGLYCCLIPVETPAEGLAIRKKVDALHKSLGLTTFHFCARTEHVESVGELSIFGLTKDESARFQDKAPPGKMRFLSV